jgi:broad specificity phosphatase PhoE
LLAHLRVDRVASSPARRCLETLHLLPEAALPCVTDERLWEIDNGWFSGLTEDEARHRHPEHYQAWLDAPQDVRPGGGESLSEMQARVVEAVDDLRALKRPDETVLVVTHGGPIRVLLCRFNGVPLQAFHQLRCENLGLFRLNESPPQMSQIDARNPSP